MTKKSKKSKAKSSKKSRKSSSSSNGKDLFDKQYYGLNPEFESLRELRDLVLKSSPAERDKMVERLNRIGRIKLAVISGIFVNRENLDPTIADLLIVGDDIEKRRLMAFLKSLEAEVGKDIKYAVMEKDDFQYRLNMFDRFVWVILESPHEKIINKLGL